MALLKCCEKKHWFAAPLIHCWCEGNLHSRQTQGRSGLSLAGWLDTSSLSSGLRFGSSHSALAHNLQAGFAEKRGGKKKNKSRTNQAMQTLSNWHSSHANIHFFVDQLMYKLHQSGLVFRLQVRHTYLSLTIFLCLTLTGLLQSFWGQCLLQRTC